MPARRRRLTDAGIAKLPPEPREYTIWDTRLSGLGIRVRPSGHKSFVHLRRGVGERRATLGPATLITVEAARRRCVAREAQAEPERRERCLALTFGEFVAEVRPVWLGHCKPSTRSGIVWLLETRLLPKFGTLPLDRITRVEVVRWFDDYSLTAPGGANWALSSLQALLNRAVNSGLIDVNPAQDVRRNPRRKLTRFLSGEEVNRLHVALDECVGVRPSLAPQADIIRLLLLTGCRRSEILNLRWREIDDRAINLTDSKTGPRTVILSKLAREILERQPKAESTYAFPSPFDPGQPRSRNLTLWDVVRRKAEIEDVRLHDLRHTYASHAVLSGVPLPVVSRLLGHRQPSMTLRYAHVGDRDTKAAAERIGSAIAGLLDKPVDAGETDAEESANG